MTAEELDLLKASEDRILAIELVTGEQFFAEIVMVVDEPPTPDVLSAAASTASRMGRSSRLRRQESRTCWRISRGWRRCPA